MVPGTGKFVMSLKKVNKASQSKLETWAGTSTGGGSHQNADDDNAVEGDNCDGDDNQGLSEVVQEVHEFRKRKHEVEVEDEDEIDNDEEDESLETWYEMLEQYEAQQASTDCSHKEDGDLAKEVAVHEMNAANAPDIDIDESWTDQQKEETMEVHRSRAESELVQAALNKGAKVQGKQFMDIANAELAETQLMTWNRTEPTATVFVNSILKSKRLQESNRVIDPALTTDANGPMSNVNVSELNNNQLTSQAYV